MNFGAPGMLSLLALLPLVLLLHLRRRREVTMGSLIVWRRIAQHVDRPSTRLRSLAVNASLILQLLVVTALVLAVARPMVGVERATEHLIAVLDSSIAMRFIDVAPDRFQAARAELATVAATLPPDTLLSIITVEEVTRIELARHGGVEELRDVLSPLHASDALADWGTAINVAAPLVDPDERTQIVVFTATEARAAASEAFAYAFPTADVATVAYGAPSPAHAGLADVVAVPRGAQEGSWTVTGRLVGVGLPREPVRIEAHVRPDGTEGFLSWSVTEATPDAHGDATFDLALNVPGPALLQLRLAEGADRLPSDDRALVALRPPSPVRVLWVGREHAALERALLAIPDLSLDRASRLPGNVDSYDLVILDGVHSASVPSTSTLWLGVGPWSEPPERLADPTPTAWASGHALIEGIDAGGLTLEAALDFPVLTGADVLIESAGAPLLQARTTDLGRQVVVAFDMRLSNWPTQAAFPAFIAAVVDWATPDRRVTEPNACAVGRSCGLPRRAFTPEWRVIGPAGDVVLEPTAFLRHDADPFAAGVWPGASYDAQFRPRWAGVYELEFASESTSMTVTAAPWAQLIDNLPGGVSGSVEPDWRIEDVARAMSLTPWLLGLGIALLVIEVVRAGRGSERFLRTAAFTDGARRRRSYLIATTSAIGLIAGALALQPAPWPVLAPRTSVAWVAPFGGDEDGRPGRIDRLVHYGPGPGPTVSSESPPLPSELADALGLALALLPSRERQTIHIDAPRDEPLTPGSFVNLTHVLSPENIDLVLQAPSSRDSEGIRLDRASVPARIRAGDTVSVALVAHNDRSEPVDLEIYLGEERVYDETVPQGRNRQDADFQAPSVPGMHSLSLRLSNPAGEPIWTTTVGLEVRPAARALILSTQAEASARLAELLELQGLNVTVTLPRRMPVTLERLSAFDVAILLDVAAAELQSGHQALLEAWVATRGGGLVILGGEQTFGAGGYFRTPLEDLSPLSARIPDELPQATLVFVLDRSGSMQAPVGTGTRLDVAKQATVEAFELLAPESRIAVVAFDAAAETVAPITPLFERDALEAAVASVRVGGGTAIYPALVRARDLIANEASSIRHVIVITDGLSQPGDFEGVLADLRAASATASFIGIGDGADGAQLARLAGLGGGSFHLTRDVRALPSIMTQEAMQLASDPVEIAQLPVAWTNPRPEFLLGIEGDPLPLEGFVRTSAKDEATVHLTDVAGDIPLLASWRYGLGRVVAFASQPVGPWTRSWTATPDLLALWPQIVRWTAGDVRRTGLSVDLQAVGSHLILRVDAADEELTPLEGLVVRTALLDQATGEVVHRVRLLESFPGRYEASVRIDGDPRTYTVRTSTDTGDEAPSERMVVMPAVLSGRLMSDDGGPRLSHLAAAVDGLRGSDTPAPGARWKVATPPSARAWLLVALTCYLLSLALRYRPHLFSRRTLPVRARVTTIAPGPPVQE